MAAASCLFDARHDLVGAAEDLLDVGQLTCGVLGHALVGPAERVGDPELLAGLAQLALTERAQTHFVGVARLVQQPAHAREPA